VIASTVPGQIDLNDGTQRRKGEMMLERAATAARRRIAAAMRPVRHESYASGGRPPRILFVNDLWGYGTVTMSMAIAEELEGRATRIFAGMGPGFELARRSSFDGLVPVDTMADPLPQDLERELGACQAVVSVMNEGVARAAARRRIPCVFVDCLLWMWATPPEVPEGVPYFQESFPGARERLDRHRDTLRSAEMVGPLVTRPARARSGSPDAVLINFGGLSCPLLTPATLVTYADAMAQCAVAALHGWPGRVVVGVGRHVLDQMDHGALRSLGESVAVVDLGHDAYLAELRRSRLLITSAGNHALYEAFALGVPCLCLPSQNLSGLLTVDIFDRQGVTSSLDWRRLYGLTDLDPADQAGACNRIAACIERFSKDTKARGQLIRHLRNSLSDRRLVSLQRRQARFYAGLGEPGAPAVAARVLELVEDRHRATLPEGA
jgi:hypothetical protein